ncbi:IclR family transcriptional regulator [Streptomyces sp. NBC_00873]|uniref:IclR family transcriptional regulator n=1 Tax=unclassified Streptomyces TaxID=2593676 RepID=UPI0038683AF4|nr:IclR family transcriptional regulator [Streptomyces sp. NBC_00873]WSY96740.1 IclR family transcriptional regulator [Streptomyces sp. NBC_00873]WTA41486.1 IclR family transcriptional regulator [Streptomyces sp. NBC_00842]WTA48410.1 IclR family transcriptional regulator [Streptomyces sp. NBC_00842]
MPAPQVSGDRSIIDRTFSVLEAFNFRDRTLTMSDISQRSGLPVATTYRIVKKLLSWGALERTEGSRYSIGLQLWEIALLAPQYSALRAVAMPYMLQLQAHARASVALTVQDKLEGICLESVWSGEASCRGAGSVGNRFPLYSAASGRVLLAYASPEMQEEFYAQDPHAYTKWTETDPLVLRAHVDRAKRQGYAICDREMNENYCSVAAPVFDGTGAVIAAISLITGTENGDATQRAKPVLTTAKLISERFAALHGPEGEKRRRRPARQSR